MLIAKTIMFLLLIALLIIVVYAFICVNQEIDKIWERQKMEYKKKSQERRNNHE